MKTETKLHLGAMGYRDVRGDSSLWAKPVGKALLIYRNSSLYLLFRSKKDKTECWDYETLNEDQGDEDENQRDFLDRLVSAEANMLADAIEYVLCPESKRGFAFVDSLRGIEADLC